MILSYLYNILKFKKWEIFFFVTVFVGLKWSKFMTFQPDVNHLTELHKCPACYGTSACDYIHEVDITPVLNNNKVILKKLAHSSELNEFDRMLCRDKHLSCICTKNLKEVTNEIDNVDFHDLIKQEVTLDFAKDNFSRLRICPNVQHLNSLLQRIYHNNKDVDKRTLDINIWTLIVLNPEPLLLQILSANENWPVPKYLGACGRIIVEEYVGLPLTTYYNKPWLLRAKIVSSLLNAAQMFTYENNNFGFYLTDVSADNIAVDSNNNAKFIDLENVIVVDKNVRSEESSKTWNQLHENTENFTCSGCLIFSSVDICNHKISDHNYYAICKMLFASHTTGNTLPDGFLHDIPAGILQTYPNILNLMQQCITPVRPSTRIIAGMQLKQLLDTIVENKTTNINKLDNIYY